MLSHISRVHTNCFVSMAIFLASAIQDDRGKYVRRNFPLRPSFTSPNPPRKSQRSWRILPLLAYRTPQGRVRRKLQDVANKRNDIVGAKLRREISVRISTRNKSGNVALSNSQRQCKFDRWFIAKQNYFQVYDVAEQKRIILHQNTIFNLREQ